MSITGPQRMPIHSDFQSIDADYYNLTDAQGWPIAGLLVLLDRKQRPVRTELHLHTDTVGQAEEMAVRQAMNMLEQRYPSNAQPGTRDARLDLRILRAYQERDTIQVGLLPGPVADRRSRPPYLIWGAVGIGAILLVWALIWLVGALFGGEEMPQVTDQPAPTAMVQSQSAAQPATNANSANSTSATTSDSTVPNPAAPVETPFPPQTNGLASSRNAVPFTLGQRVRIAPGLTLTLRSQPGADAGEQIGFMQDGQAATLIGGPVWMPGLSDTIVWWYARLDTGQEAWIPANTSELTLLEAAP